MCSLMSWKSKFQNLAKWRESLITDLVTNLKKRAKYTKIQDDELADVIYTVICMANSQSIELDEPLKSAIAKLETRDKCRFAKE